jgi:hypothetical protein
MYKLSYLRLVEYHCSVGKKEKYVALTRRIIKDCTDALLNELIKHIILDYLKIYSHV